MVPIHPIPRPEQVDTPPAYPADSLCYLLGANGVFKQLENDFYAARVPAPGVAGLARLEASACIRLPKLSLELFHTAEAFLVEVYARHQSEGVVLLLADPAVQAWRLEIPRQRVRGLHVAYDLADLPEPPEGFRRFGSIHSHAQLPAFHSGTDDRDEARDDGLHITIGNLDRPLRSYSARWYLAGHAFEATLEEVVALDALPEPDEVWLARVEPDPIATRRGGLFEPRERALREDDLHGPCDPTEEPWNLLDDVPDEHFDKVFGPYGWR